LFAILAWDFGFYWLHRLHHNLRPLWAVHVVHHQGEHFNLSLGVRNSWYSSLTAIPFFLVLAIIGVPLSVFLVVSVAHYSVQFLNHNALTPKLGWLEKVFVTPSHHRVHHYKERRFADSNYGGTFIFWDKLFGTFCRITPPQGIGYGVKGEPPSSNPLRESNLPFLRMVGARKKSAPQLRQFTASASSAIVGAILLVRNLLDNALRYSPRGSVVDVTLEAHRCRVRDNGPGIAPEALARIGERFYRPPGQEATGSGLGLSIVKRIAALHRMRVEIGNAAEGGCEVQLRW
jgi:anti-sigma regulatory factor (Ser/Thr protein kinase)